MVVVDQIVSKNAVAHAVAIDTRAAADTVLIDNVLFHKRKRDDAVARGLKPITIHMDSRGVIMVRSVPPDGWIVGAVAVVYPVLAVESRFVILNQRVVAKGQKYSCDRRSMDVAILHGNEISDADVDPVTRRVRRFQAVDHPVANSVVK